MTTDHTETLAERLKGAALVWIDGPDREEVAAKAVASVLSTLDLALTLDRLHGREVVDLIELARELRGQV